MAERRRYSEAELNEMYPSRAAQARADEVSTAAGAYTGSAAADKRKAGPWWQNTSGWDNPALGLVLGLGTMGMAGAPGIAGKIGTMLGGKMAGGGTLKNVARYAPQVLGAASKLTGSRALGKASSVASALSPWAGGGTLSQKLKTAIPSALHAAGDVTGKSQFHDVGRMASAASPLLNRDQGMMQNFREALPDLSQTTGEVFNQPSIGAGGQLASSLANMFTPSPGDVTMQADQPATSNVYAKRRTPQNGVFTE